MLRYLCLLLENVWTQQVITVIRHPLGRYYPIGEVVVTNTVSTTLVMEFPHSGDPLGGYTEDTGRARQTTKTVRKPAELPTLSGIFQDDPPVGL